MSVDQPPEPCFLPTTCCKKTPAIQWPALSLVSPVFVTKDLHGSCFSNATSGCCSWNVKCIISFIIQSMGKIMRQLGVTKFCSCSFKLYTSPKVPENTSPALKSPLLDPSPSRNNDINLSWPGSPASQQHQEFQQLWCCLWHQSWRSMGDPIGSHL